MVRAAAACLCARRRYRQSTNARVRRGRGRAIERPLQPSAMDFDTAVAKSKDCKSASNDDKLSLYKHYKQVR